MDKKINRIAILSIHTSPQHQPGVGDSGGMNVYVAETAKLIAAQGIDVEIFTRATRATDPEISEIAPGVKVRNLPAGPFEGLPKSSLPAQLCAITAGLLRAEAEAKSGFYDLIHSHYWLSGQVGWIAKERWGVPLVHTMHTMARVKNASLAQGDAPEPEVREIGEEQVVAIADALVANTDQEAQELIELYQADPKRVKVINPGVDLQQFVPGNKFDARELLGIDPHKKILLFVGRIQPLKAPDVLLKAAAELVLHNPELRQDLIVAICGGPSGSGLDEPEALQRLANELGINDLVRFIPPINRENLVTWFQAADVCAVPSYSESFGLVALEAQACGTPVIAARVGGLATTVADGVSGLLVDGHDRANWANAIYRLVTDQELHASLSSGALTHAAKFSWSNTASKLIQTYEEVI